VSAGIAAVVTALCRAEGWPVPVHEHVFAPPRRWRFDLAWPLVKLAVEVQGGLFTRGRHVQGPALLREMEKLNRANVDGWAVVLVTPQQVRDGTLTNWLQEYFTRWAVEGT
jgi:hypothetical protein